MKTKILPLLSGAFALLLAASPMVPLFTQTALAETTQSVRGEGKLAKLNLTAEQQVQIKKIRESAHQQMDAVFTPEQKAQLQVSRKDRQKLNLNLTEGQKGQLKAIRTEVKSQMDAILTPEQQKQLQEMKSARPQKP
ncbi:MAG: Spy/CpxP family protein refolding chaperone [Microcystaceae cyanobacterium]